MHPDSQVQPNPPGANQAPPTCAPIFGVDRLAHADCRRSAMKANSGRQDGSESTAFWRVPSHLEDEAKSVVRGRPTIGPVLGPSPGGLGGCLVLVQIPCLDADIGPLPCRSVVDKPDYHKSEIGAGFDRLRRASARCGSMSSLDFRRSSSWLRKWPASMIRQSNAYASRLSVRGISLT